MANHVNPGVLPTDDFRRVKTPTRISWGAIFAGVVIAIAIQLVLGILGTGIGLSLVDPVEGTTPWRDRLRHRRRDLLDHHDDHRTGCRWLCRSTRRRRA